jgi:hypothetical protein
MAYANFSLPIALPIGHQRALKMWSARLIIGSIFALCILFLVFLTPALAVSPKSLAETSSQFQYIVDCIMSSALLGSIIAIYHDATQHIMPIKYVMPIIGLLVTVLSAFVPQRIRPTTGSVSITLGKNRKINFSGAPRYAVAAAGLLMVAVSLPKLL